MQYINQTLFVVFSLLMLAVLAGTINTNKNEYHPYIAYWRYSITLRALAFFSWALAPTFSNLFVTLANFCFAASGIALCLVFRSIRIKISKNLLSYLFLMAVMFVFSFEVVRQQENSYATRLIMMGGINSLITLWELTELFLLHKRDRSIGLKIVGTVTLMQFLLTMIFIVFAVVGVEPGENQITQEQGIINLWAGVGSHLISFIIISSYLFQRTVESERNALKSLINRTNQLDVATKEKEEISRLLEEKQALIGSLIVAKKSAEAGALSASIAHELNQPLGAIHLNVQFLQSKIESNNLDFSLLKKLISTIGEDNQRAANVVSTLRKVFNQNELETKPIYINDLIESLMPILLPHARDNLVQIKLELESKLLVDISISEFQQVLFNLINNAIEELMGLELPEKIVLIRTEDDGEFVKLSVSDNGKGIPEGFKSSIFELMKSSKQDGMGLGLWLTRHIVERHRGRISYKPAMMGGAQFEILLPKA